MIQNRSNSEYNPLIVVLGPTANGKTKLAIELAKQLNGEIISVDSRQVFRRMDIGTGKDLEEYGKLPYHLINIKNPGEEYNLFNFAEDFIDAYSDILSRGKLPIAAGGTGLYLDAFLNRYQMTRAEVSSSEREKLLSKSHEDLQKMLLKTGGALHNTTDLLDKQRTVRAIEIANVEASQQNTLQWPKFNPLVLGLQYPRAVTRERIASRLLKRFDEGMLEEVQALLNTGTTHDQLEHYGLEYRYISQHLRGELSYNDMLQKLRSAICQFAKQQEKWFRKIDSKLGQRIHWLNTESDFSEEALDLTMRYLNQFATKSVNS